MPLRNTIIFSIVLFLAGMSSLLTEARAGDEKTYQHMMIEDLGINDIDAARQYAIWIQPIAKRHQVSLNVFEVIEAKKGGAFDKPTFYWIIQFNDPDALKALGSDPEYQANIPNRDVIFDFSAQNTYTVKKVN